MKVYMVTAYVPTSRQQGVFRTIGVVAADEPGAYRTASEALIPEVRDAYLVSLFQVLTATALPERTVINDVHGNGYIITVLLAPIGGTVHA